MLYRIQLRSHNKQTHSMDVIVNAANADEAEDVIGGFILHNGNDLYVAGMQPAASPEFPNVAIVEL